jgi:acyl-CoA synthetase (AMP-forming)/AMP-acid ligase II
MDAQSLAAHERPTGSPIAPGLICVADIIARRAAAAPTAPAVICGGRTLSFTDLNRRADRVAAALMHDGVGVGGRVAHCAQADEIYYDFLFGAAKSRATFVPLNWRLSLLEIIAILNDSAAEVLFLGPDYENWAAALQAGCTQLRRILTASGVLGADTAYDAWLGAAPAGGSRRAPVADDDVVQLYTSGTTGLPKGVVLTNANYSAIVQRGVDAGWDWTPADRVLMCMPLFHVGGVNGVLVAMQSGACAVLSARADVATIIDFAERYRITVTFLAPALVAAVARAVGQRTEALSAIRTIYYGTAPISETVLAEARTVFTAGFAQGYGLTETAGGMTYLSPADHESGGPRLRSCGKPNAGTDIRVVSPDGTPLPAGESGEIVMRGPTLMKAYWRRPEDTAAAMQGGWFHTGDVGYFDIDGYLYIHDRLKDMIVTGGENVYPTEVENVLVKHPAILEATVVGVPDPRWGEAVKAVVVTRPDQAVEQDEIIAFARQHLAGYKLPKSIDFVASVPRNALGKVLRREVRNRYWSGRDRLIN